MPVGAAPHLAEGGRGANRNGAPSRSADIDVGFDRQAGL
jgi:hypothetical protein